MSFAAAFRQVMRPGRWARTERTAGSAVRPRDARAGGKGAAAGREARGEGAACLLIGPDAGRAVVGGGAGRDVRALADHEPARRGALRVCARWGVKKERRSTACQRTARGQAEPGRQARGREGGDRCGRPKRK